MTSRSRAAWSLLCAAWIAPCATSAAAQVRDSADVQIVMNRSPSLSATAALRLASTPLLVIGARAGTMYELSKVAGAARLTGGRIVIGDGASRRLRFYDSMGTFLNALGRQGDGPGEFQTLRTLQVVGGDTIVAGSAVRLSLFTGTGRPVRSVSPLAPPAQLPAGEEVILAAFASGTTVMGSIPNWRETKHPPQTGRRWTDSIQLGVFGDGNKLLKTLGRSPVRVLEWRELDLMLPTFSPELLAANTAQHLFLGFGTEYSIQVYSSSGVLERIIRRTWVAERVNIDLWATQQVRQTGTLTGAAADAKRKELRDGPYAVVAPAFSQLLADRAGRLWVRESHPADFVRPGDPASLPSVWNVFSAEGKWLCNVGMPAHFLPTDIGSDYVLGVARDSDGLETVVMYRLGMK